MHATRGEGKKTHTNTHNINCLSEACCAGLGCAGVTRNVRESTNLLNCFAHRPSRAAASVRVMKLLDALGTIKPLNPHCCSIVSCLRTYNDNSKTDGWKQLRAFNDILTDIISSVPAWTAGGLRRHRRQCCHFASNC